MKVVSLLPTLLILLPTPTNGFFTFLINRIVKFVAPDLESDICDTVTGALPDELLCTCEAGVVGVLFGLIPTGAEVTAVCPIQGCLGGDEEFCGDCTLNVIGFGGIGGLSGTMDGACAITGSQDVDSVDVTGEASISTSSIDIESCNVVASLNGNEVGTCTCSTDQCSGDLEVSYDCPALGLSSDGCINIGSIV